MSVRSDDAEPAGALGDDHASVGKELEAPRMLEPLRHRHDAHRRLYGFRRGRAWRLRVDVGWSAADEEHQDERQSHASSLPYPAAPSPAARPVAHAHAKL